MNSNSEHPEQLGIHGSAVEHSGSAVVLIGPSRSGKSTLVLELMAFGARLVSDDLIVLHRSGDRLVVSSPPDAPRGIEASGFGILAADRVGSAEVALLIDLGLRETERLPPLRQRRLLGVAVDVVHGAGNENLAAATLQFLKSGRIA